MFRTQPLLRLARGFFFACLALEPISNVIRAEGEAGPDQDALTPATVQLVSQAPLGWSVVWSQVGGAPVALGGVTSATASATLSTPGRYRFRLDATGPAGQQLSDEVELFGFGPADEGVVVEATHLWHKVELTFDGGETLGEAGSIDPFLDRRLDVRLWHPESGEQRIVPGFFAADGQAADSGASTGSLWRARFTPSRSGLWHYVASARAGAAVAIGDALDGSPTGADSASGSFVVGPAKLDAPGNLARGLLRYVDDHHLRFEGTAERYLKTGADSPENWLGYHEFDQTTNLGGVFEGNLPNGLHTFSPHIADFRASTPEALAATWRGGLGAGILGALDYLESAGVNSIYFLTYNIDGGDGRDTWPWTSPTERTRFDVSKLEQWERVFTYADARGIQLHVVLQETENDTALGDDLSTVRTLYFREMIARFSHHLALQWNLGEENHNSVEARRAFAAYFEEHDPYAHPVAFHTDYGAVWTVYDAYHGDPELDATSIQGAASLYHGHVKVHRERSQAAGRPWVIYGDEQGPAVDASMSNVAALRRTALYGNLMAGGAGVEWYFGYQTPEFGDIQLEDFSLAAPLWQTSRNAREFFESHVNVEHLVHDEWLTSEADDYVLAEHGHTYLVYRPFGGSASLNLGAFASTFEVRWFDPTNGGSPVAGTVTSITGPGVQSIGTPPFQGDALAWIVGGSNRRPVLTEVVVEPSVLRPGDDCVVRALAEDPDGPADPQAVGIFVQGPAGGFLGGFPLDVREGRRWAREFTNLNMAPGVYTLFPIVQDRLGAWSFGATQTVEMLP